MLLSFCLGMATGRVQFGFTLSIKKCLISFPSRVQTRHMFYARIPNLSCEEKANHVPIPFICELSRVESSLIKLMVVLLR